MGMRAAAGEAGARCYISYAGPRTARSSRACLAGGRAPRAPRVRASRAATLYGPHPRRGCGAVVDAPAVF